MNKLLLLLIAIILFFPIFSHAQSYDPLIVLKNPVLASCPCKTLVYNVEIQNNLAYDDIFFISTNFFEEYIQYSENPVNVKAAEKKPILVFLNLPCEIYGNFKPYLQFHSQALNSDYAVQMNVEVYPCYDYEANFVDYSTDNRSIIFHKGDYNICQGDAKQIPISIKNMADFDNLYYLGLKSPKWIWLKQDNAIVPANSSRLIFLEIVAPTTYIGEETTILSFYSKRGELFKSISANFKVDKCYGISIELSNITKTCQCKEEDYNLILKNLGKDPEKINLKVEGPDWVTLEKDSVLVIGGQEKKVALNAKIPCDKKGKFEIKVLADIDGKEGFNVEKIFNLNIQSQAKCTSQKTTFSSKNLIYLGILILLTVSCFVLYLIYKNRESKGDDKKYAQKEKISPKKEIAIKKKEEETEIYHDQIPKQLGKWALNIVVLLLLLVALTAIGTYFNIIINFLKPYWRYILIGIIILIIVLTILTSKRRKPKRKKLDDDAREIKKEERKAPEKKYKKEKTESFAGYGTKKILSAITLLVILALISYVIFYFRLFPYILQFLKLYSIYFLVGIALLIVSIIVWKKFEKD